MTKEQHPNDIAYSNGYKQGVFDTEMRYQIIDTPEATSRVGDHKKTLRICNKTGVHTCRLGSIHLNEREAQILTEYLTTKDQEKEEAVKAEQMRIKKEIAFHTPALTAKKPKAYNDGLLSGWYACREFVNLLTRALPTEDNN